MTPRRVMEIRMEIGKVFFKDDFQRNIDLIIEQLSDKDCQRVEFLRGKLSTYKELIGVKEWQEYEDKRNIF